MFWRGSPPRHHDAPHAPGDHRRTGSQGREPRGGVPAHAGGLLGLLPHLPGGGGGRDFARRTPRDRDPPQDDVGEEIQQEGGEGEAGSQLRVHQPGG